VNAQGNPATPLQRTRNSQHIVRAAFPADTVRFLPLVFSSLHQTFLLKFHQPRLNAPAIRRDAGTPARVGTQARMVLAGSELEQIRRSRSEADLM
jgi:hypothetical protein